MGLRRLFILVFHISSFYHKSPFKALVLSLPLPCEASTMLAVLGSTGKMLVVSWM